jgi:hypothetical protein
VRVGRAAFDEDAIRLIEEHNPEVDFDWTQILRGKEPPAELKPQETPLPGQRQPLPVREPRTAVHDQRTEARPAEPSAPADEIDLETEPVVFSSVIEEEDATLAGGEPAAEGPEDLERPTPAAAAKLGPEGLVRLRARYAEILARISDRVSDPIRQEELKSQAERLNPDAWVTDTEVAAGLEQYESVFDALQSVVGRRRRRRRRRRGTESAGHRGSGQTPGHDDGQPDADDNDGTPE